MSEATQENLMERVQEDLRKAHEFVSSRELLRTAEIQDYPIGRADRGKCNLAVERKDYEYRTVRTTTDKYGVWCKPKKSTFRWAPMCVVEFDDPEVGMTFGWLLAYNQGVYILKANGDSIPVVETFRKYPPRREPKQFTATETRKYIENGEFVRKTTDILPADPPEVCDAWDAWVAGIQSVRDKIRAVWE